MKLIYLFIAVSIFFVNSAAAEPKVGKAKLDSDRKAFAEQRLKEQQEDEYEEKNRWIWRYTLKNNESYWLHTSNRPTACKGNLQAVKTRWQLNEHETIQELCWYKKSGETYITITDPKAYLLSTTKIDAAKFDYIPSNKEKKAAALAEQNRRLSEAILENYSRTRREEKIQFDSMASPIIMDINGNLVTCIKIGVVLDCD